MVTKDELYRTLQKIEDPVKRRAFFAAMLSKEIVNLGGKMPVLVGGEALEIYTQGSYTTGDIDIKTTPDEMRTVLQQWGFETTEGNLRLWINEELDMYIDWRGVGLEEGAEAEKRVNSVVINNDLRILVLSFEDLIIDRLCAVKFWGDTDSEMWAGVVYGIAEKVGRIDMAYLKSRASQEDIINILEDMLLKISESSEKSRP